MDFSKFLGGLVLSKVEGLLLCIKKRKLETKVRSMKKILLKILSSKYLAYTATTKKRRTFGE